jgi:hypothetical protein
MRCAIVSGTAWADAGADAAGAVDAGDAADVAAAASAGGVPGPPVQTQAAAQATARARRRDLDGMAATLPRAAR